MVKQTLDDDQVAFMFVHWSKVATPPTGLDNFDPTRHFVTNVEGEGNAHPGGMSGSAGCTQRKRGDQLWVADLDFAGVTITFYESEQLLKLVKRECVEGFLKASF